MKKSLVVLLGLGVLVSLTSCKSRESLYKQAYEKAKNQATETNQTGVSTTTVAVNPQAGNDEVKVTPVTTNPVSSTVSTDNSDVRTIQSGYEVVSGNSLKEYSVVVGSFITEANANGLAGRLKQKGYEARVLKTNETINGQTGWYRVVATSFSDKASAAASRNELKAEFPGAWLLYSK